MFYFVHTQHDACCATGKKFQFFGIVLMGRHFILSRQFLSYILFFYKFCLQKKLVVSEAVSYKGLR